MDVSSHSIEFDRMSFLNAILATLPEAVAIIGLDHRIAELNPAGLALLGANSMHDIPDDAPLSLIEPAHIPQFKEHFLAATAGGVAGPPEPLFLNVRGLDRSLRSIECRMAPLRDTDGSIAGVVVTARDGQRARGESA